MDIVSILQTRIETDDDKNSYDNKSTYEASCKQAIHFLICDSCHWCASSIRFNAPLNCPSCNDSEVEWISISDRRNPKFDHDLNARY